MKKNIINALFVSVALLFLPGCQDQETVMPAKGNVTFLVLLDDDVRNEIPVSVLFSIKDSKENQIEDIKLPLTPSGQKYISEILELKVDNYLLTKFILLDAANKILYASPMEGSRMANYVTNPLLMPFTVSAEATTQITPQVLPVSSIDIPSDFGLESFQAAVTSNDATILIKTNVKIKVGNILYENVDADILVRGYDENNSIRWTRNYKFIGPADNVLEIKNGFHHYSIVLVDKWGVTDTRDQLAREELWESRADGPLPATFVLAGTVAAKKLSRYVTSREINVPGEGIVYRPETRVSYLYNDDGRLESAHYERYDFGASQFVEYQSEVFIYDGSAVSKIQVNGLEGQPSTEYHYVYGDQNTITQVSASDHQTLWIQTATTNPENRRVTVSYNYFTGSSFIYEFDFLLKNMVDDRTVKDNRICNERSFSYDKSINPFRHLGYIDFFFENWSANNIVAQSANYFACSFPASAVPVAHSYTYDHDGYPVKKVTTYSQSFPSTYPYHSETIFYYEKN
jgi:hypothetical protein